MAAELSDLNERSWAHESSHFAALGHPFAIRTSEVKLGEYLSHVFADLRPSTKDGPITLYSFVTDDPAPWPYALYVDGRRVVRSEHASYVIDYLLWHVNRQAVERTPELLRIHAAAVVRDGIAGVLAAEAENGKTTLTAGLLQRGYRYLTDEAVAIDHETRSALPFAKALSVDPGSWDVLSDLEPDLDAAVRADATTQWRVPASAIAAGAVAAAAPVRVVLLPMYRAGADSQLISITRAEMVMALTSLSFHFTAAPKRNLEVLRDIVLQSACFRLVVGELAQGCELVDQAFDAATTG